MKNATQIKKERRIRRHRRSRAKIMGTKGKPRLSVYRSSKNIYLQLIDDEAGRTLLGLSGAKLFSAKKIKMTKTEQALKLGGEFAKQAIQKKITKAVFDRGGYKFHGRVKAAAEGIKKGGLQI